LPRPSSWQKILKERQTIKPLAGILISLLLAAGSLSAGELFARVCIRDFCVKAEVAETAPKRRQGLMHRPGLSPEEGMLFIFEDEGMHSFWMKNVKFPLDILWISKEKTVVDVIKDAPPCGKDCPSLKPKARAKYVLELSAGSADKHNINIGDSVNF
jgi:uncharacterized membrane protein (UPF0127 family)